MTAFCSEISIEDSNITNNIITTNTNNNINDDCLLCFGYDTITTMNNNIFDNNDGIMIYSSYLTPSKSSNYRVTLNMNGNTFKNQYNTGIVLQSNTNYPSQISITNMNVKDSSFGSNSFIVLYPNLNSNIKIMDSTFNNNNGPIITSKVSSILCVFCLSHKEIIQ